MGTKTFNNYESLLTFTRASGGHALRPVSYGDELVTNGTFDSDTTGWTNAPSYLLDTFELDAGRLHIENTAGTTQAAYTDDNISLVAGKIYRFTAELEKVGGSDNWEIDIRTQGTGTTRHSLTTTATTETLQVIFVATQTENTAIQITTRNTFEGYIDNVSVKEVTFDESDGILTLFEHPNNIPRVEWDAQRNRLGLLVEESRTNLDTQSTYFSGAASVTATKNYTAPDGSQDASTLDYTAVSTPYLNTTNISFSSGTTYSFSFYFKRGTGTQAVQTLLYGSAFNSGGANCVVIFDLNNETTSVASGTFVSHSITNVGGGWYRCMCSATATATVSQNQQILRLGGADDGNYDYIWGKQVEAGSFPTSYIKTTGATATRSADVASIPTADFGFNHKEGTIFAEFSGQFNESGTLFPRPYELSGGNSSNDRVTVYFAESNGNLAAEVRNGGVQSAGLVLQTGVSSNFTAIKTAFAFKADDFAATEDGDTPVTDTAGTLTPSTPRDELALMGTVTGSQTLNGHLKSIKYYPRRLTNAQLQDITS